MHAVQPLLEGLPDAPRLGERIALAMGVLWPWASSGRVKGWTWAQAAFTPCPWQSVKALP